ncbi:response regulator transcription factor [Wenyingzhuangia aestuarii]|uniref:response regulator transcription factor n=1 Tax=Wenyingzhuangia aestuarii TaxID=1647582 RepID=UPI001439FE4A|nr:response regulator transcription factor [Wenyingzhuangia aestuarii]NJB82675.1 CheY-like chemotaxis protein [Wenyingzhuangia aestuarii]
MKLDYRIIWVEDKIEDKPFQGIKKKINDYLADEFFNVSIETAEDFEEFKTIYEVNNTFDLIITDLNLNDSHGNEVIDFVRDEKHILTEVFFYSANSEFSDIKLVNNNRITFHQMDGASAYRELENSIIELIKLTIAKFQHIVSMRGMIMQETSSLDAKTYDMVSLYVNENDDEVRVALYDELVSFFGRKFKLSEKSKKNNNINSILKDPLLLTSAQRANVLSEIINKKGLDNFINDFKNEIINVRNQFAHAELIKNKDGKEYFRVKGEEVSFDKKLCKEIRKNIIKHANNINNLEGKL